MQGLAVGQAKDLDPPTGTFAHVKAPLPDNDAERLVEFARTAARAGVIRIDEIFVLRGIDGPVRTLTIYLRRNALSAKGTHKGPSSIGEPENLHLMVIHVRHVDEAFFRRKGFWTAKLFCGAYLSTKAVTECARVDVQNDDAAMHTAAACHPSLGER